MPKTPASVEAERLVAARLSIIPVAANGTKAPATWLLPRDPETNRPTWIPYQHQRPTLKELSRWFASNEIGLGIVGGAISDNLEILDFDAADLFSPWADLVEDIIPGLLTRLPCVQTPSGGHHAFYRCAVIAGNQKLAQRLGADERPKTTIETRGEGGYVLAPGSPPACHPLNKPYVLLDGDLADIPTITGDERETLLNTARVFNAYAPPPPRMTDRSGTSRVDHQGTRPGEAFAAQTTWGQILEPQGWARVGSWKGATLWRRPGKKKGHSAVTGGAEADSLWVYSANASPFEPETPYSKFAAYALLEHAGDFQAAAKALSAKGYGEHHVASKRCSSGDRASPLPLRPYTGYRGYQSYRGYGQEVTHE